MKSYISNGWATKYLVNPDACDTSTVASSVSADLSFTGKWTNIKQAYSQPAQVPSFNHGHTLFLTQLQMVYLLEISNQSIRQQNIYMTVDMYKMLKLAIQIQLFFQELNANQKCERIVFTTC